MFIPSSIPPGWLKPGGFCSTSPFGEIVPRIPLTRRSSRVHFAKLLACASEPPVIMQETVSSNTPNAIPPKTSNFVKTKSAERVEVNNLMKGKGLERAPRQHVNPLRRRFQIPVLLPDGYFREQYANVGLPFHVDIGCAKGRFLLEMATKYPEINFLGIEIRESLVAQANHWKSALGLQNVHFMSANANVNLDAILSAYPPHRLSMVSVQYPDPHYKRRNHKRRTVTKELVDVISKHLNRESGKVFIQSDVLEVASEMRLLFSDNPHFQLIHDDHEEWLAQNPLKVYTERELSCLGRNLPVYRCLFRFSKGL